MTVVSGGQNHWQTGDINGRAHAIEKSGSHTGHAVRAVAFCDSRQTAEVLVEALKLVQEVYASAPYGHKLAQDAQTILERAGLI